MATWSSRTARRARLHNAWMVRLLTLMAATWVGGLLVETARAQCAPAWSAVWTENDDPAPVVRALTVFDDGTGPALYAGGMFEQIGGVPAHNLAKWDGQSWSEVGGGVSGNLAGYTKVDCLRALDLGDGPALYVGGDFVYAGDVEANGIARWDGTTWTGFGAGFAPDPYWNWLYVYDMRVFDDGAGASLYVGGTFETPASNHGLARWDGTAWNPVGGGLTGPVNYPTMPAIVGALGVRQLDPSILIVGGTFSKAGNVPAENVAQWDGVNWAPMGSLPFAIGSGYYPYVGALVEYDYGSGPTLFAGGSFRGGSPVKNCFARWDGSNWTRLATFRVEGDTVWTYVSGLQVFDDGNGPAFYGAGSFATITPGGGTQAVFNHMFRWNGQAFSALAVGVGAGLRDQRAKVLAVFDDGHGPALYVGGYFLTAGDVPAKGIARWGCVPGDMNCDGALNAFDIDPFVLALTDPAAYGETYPNCRILNADANCDGAVNAFDIDPFVLCLTIGCPPCP